MSKPWKARFYQNEATAAFWKALFEDQANAPLIAMPTGSGKSGVIGLICEQVKRWPSFRISVLVDVKELVAQDFKAILKVWPEAPVGIFSAGLGHKQAHMPITVGNIQSAVRNPEMFGKQNLLLVDEVQMVSPEEETSYRKFHKALKEVNPLLRIGGLSATIYRRKTGFLTDDGGLFNKVCYDITGLHAFRALIDQGYLVKLKSKPTNFRYDLTQVRVTAGEYNQGDVAAEVNKLGKTEAALQEALQIGVDSKHAIVFCSGIEHIENTAAILHAWGESVTYVHSEMSSTERDIRIEDYLNRKYRFIVSDGILTKGFDAPFVDHIIDLAPTRSVVRHVQKLGRGTRPDFADGFDLDDLAGRLMAIAASGKLFCRVSDFCGNLDRLGPINDPTIPGKRKSKKTGEMPIKICTTEKLVRGNQLKETGEIICGCGEYNFAAARYCEECGEEFRFETKIEKTASKAVAIKIDTPEVYWFKVDRVEYDDFKRPFTPVEMKVMYFCGLNRYTELIAVEHTTPYTRHKANEWWRARGYEPPLTTLDGMKLVDHLPVPTHIAVHVNTKYPRVMATSFDGNITEFDPVEGKFVKATAL